MTDKMQVDQEEQSPVITPNNIFSDVEKQLVLAQKTVVTQENRYLLRSLRRTFTNLRRKISCQVLSALVRKYFAVGNSDRELLLGLLDSFENGEKIEVAEGTYESVAPEIEVFISLLVLVFLVDNDEFQAGADLAEKLVSDLGSLNRRTLDPLSSKIFFYFSLANEKLGRLSEIRSTLLAQQRTAVLNHNFLGEVTLLNLILRNYLHYNLYDQASKLVQKVDLKSEHANSNELARYYFYCGKIFAVQLSYTQSYEYLQLALRKAPQSGALGFRALVTKYLCIVQLLLGEIPEKNTFKTPGISLELRDYFQLTRVVRSGDVAQFNQLVGDTSEKFKKDKTFNLIQRLRHNVIKTGLKKINVSYSRISIEDICDKLSLDNVEDAEFIISKAISDGIIEAKVNHEESFATSNQQTDVYATSDPQESFRDRINFCLQLHNDSVKSMRYHESDKKPEDTNK